MEATLPMDKLLIGLIDLLAEKGATRGEVYELFDRTDVSRKSNHNLVVKYHALYSNNLINKELLEANEVSDNILGFLGVKTIVLNK